ncbi:MBL fold metallo-hydrolase [Alphaproteobacteria bacterium]|jgi:glyoxylase-like metal-dependent hydrolase (beta-lactamase superfamily II)|nr:MBL fold metallo-hydrolase [Alphaproteobacteria bacterium]
MMLEIGKMQITGITDIGCFDVPLAFMFPEMLALLDDGSTGGIDPKILSGGQVHLTIRSWLLRHDNRVILIDSCVGNHKERVHWPDWHQRTDDVWLRRLHENGVRREDVDIVMCTHLHADHVGWNTCLENGRWVPTFPNARYLTGRIEYEHWLEEAANGDRHGSFNDSVMPIVEAGQMDLLTDGADIGHGLSVEMAPGHTPGQLLLNASHKDSGAVFCGDVLHSPLQLMFPDISSSICSDPVQAAVSRRTMLARLADNGHYLLPGHFSDPGWCQIERHLDGYVPITAAD